MYLALAPMKGSSKQREEKLREREGLIVGVGKKRRGYPFRCVGDKFGT
jgi:hypothetical protein